jgi:hypothetical protein
MSAGVPGLIAKHVLKHASHALIEREVFKRVLEIAEGARGFVEHLEVVHESRGGEHLNRAVGGRHRVRHVLRRAPGVPQHLEFVRQFGAIANGGLGGEHEPTGGRQPQERRGGVHHAPHSGLHFRGLDADALGHEPKALLHAARRTVERREKLAADVDENVKAAAHDYFVASAIRFSSSAAASHQASNSSNSMSKAARRVTPPLVNLRSPKTATLNSPGSPSAHEKPQVGRPAFGGPRGPFPQGLRAAAP